MKIGGLNTFSLSDYPGQVAAVVFTQGCNFRCPFCHNGRLIPIDVPKESLISEDEVLRFLKSRKDQLNGVVISGGEPTIQPDLCTFLCLIKNMDYAVKLDTNGSNPKVLRKLLENNLLDYIAIDIKAPWCKYSQLSGVNLQVSHIKQSISLISKSDIEHEFRTTVVETLLSQKNIQSIKTIVPDGSPYRLQIFKPEHAFDRELRGCRNR